MTLCARCNAPLPPPSVDASGRVRRRIKYCSGACCQKANCDRSRKKKAASLGLSYAKYARMQRVNYVPRDWKPTLHPLIKRILVEMRRQQATYAVVAKRAGISPLTLDTWRCNRMPTLQDYLAVLGALGLEFVIREEREDLEKAA